tara:strand:- start:241 stop:450 length:210 start_codon:yes stop_codon:yes gene_type:complete
MINILTTAKFSKIIIEVVETKEISYLDAITDYCQKNNLEIESAAKLVNQKIKTRLKEEARELKLIKANE